MELLLGILIFCVALTAGGRCIKLITKAINKLFDNFDDWLDDEPKKRRKK